MSTASAAAGADLIIAALRARAVPEELPKVRRRLAPDEEAFGLRMRDVFDIAKAHTASSVADVHRLLDHPAYEPRMVAICILDFKARGALDDAERRALDETYLGRHDRIKTWDMVDRAAPRVVGGHLTGRSLAPLHELAAADPVRRRTAITAPLFFVRGGSEAELGESFAIAARLARDLDPTVHNAVGIFLKHAGTRVPDRLHAFLDEHARGMLRPALRLATEKLPDGERRRYPR